MTTILRGIWTCPYCGFDNMRVIDDTSGAVEAVYCDSDEGGCDSLVVLDVRAVTVQYRVRRIEGEGAAEDTAVDWTPLAWQGRAVFADMTPEPLAVNGAVVAAHIDAPAVAPVSAAASAIRTPRTRTFALRGTDNTPPQVLAAAHSPDGNGRGAHPRRRTD